ncbi:MAG: di-trans,poly-cis-decaprenylcistransferase [Nevskiaceae bacterium]|nr:MAG: di-trans,poly-cis-decaprenylcistransferase [Nevskiaceae bacterium]TBR74174.1 MAG: di-trans,poly-cis-decaprenylcistransferase [Nevskiaceae bacterium]
MPRHIGIILDGNRRYGLSNHLTGFEAIYASGADRLDDLLAWCIDLGIPAVTLWVFSTENFDRAPEEVSGAMRAVENKLRSLCNNEDIHRAQVHVRTVGRLELLPHSTRAAVQAAEAATRDYHGLELTLAAAYGGREEIVDAVKSYLDAPERRDWPASKAAAALTADAIAEHLYAPNLPDLDLVIRTSGEIRLSGFLLWQSAYSEFYFTDVFWPAFRRIDFLRAIRAYQQRKRRFGH